MLSMNVVATVKLFVFGKHLKTCQSLHRVPPLRYLCSIIITLKWYYSFVCKHARKVWHMGKEGISPAEAGKRRHVFRNKGGFLKNIVLNILCETIELRWVFILYFKNLGRFNWNKKKNRNSVIILIVFYF